MVRCTAWQDEGTAAPWLARVARLQQRLLLLLLVGLRADAAGMVQARRRQPACTRLQQQLLLLRQEQLLLIWRGDAVAASSHWPAAALRCWLELQQKGIAAAYACAAAVTPGAAGTSSMHLLLLQAAVKHNLFAYCWSAACQSS
jgi:hypothetical protein